LEINHMHKTHNPEKKVKLKTVIISGIITIIALVILNALPVYLFGTDNFIESRIVEIIPYPAVIIDNTHFISISDLKSNAKAVRQFYESQDFSKAGLRVDFSTEDGAKRLKLKERDILNKMIEDRLIILVSKKNGIKVSDSEVDDNVSRALSEYGNKEDNVQSKLLTLYGWTMEDFKEKVVKPDLYRKQLEKVYQKDGQLDADVLHKKISEANSTLESGGDFSKIANTYSDGPSKENGGELGWFKKEQLLPEIADTVFKLNRGKRTDVLESPIGFHIIELDDFRIADGIRTMVKLRQIFVAKKTFGDWLQEKKAEFKIIVPLKNYSWDIEQGSIVLSSQDMIDFEKRIQEKAQGDASVEN